MKLIKNSKTFDMSRKYNSNYIYELENRLYRSEGKIDGEANRKRTILITWLFEVSKVLKTSFSVWPLTVTLFDTYEGLVLSKTLLREDIPAEEFQCVGLACFHLSSCLLEIYPPLIEELVYLSDEKCTPILLMEAREKVMVMLDGKIIRASQIFYLNGRDAISGDEDVMSLLRLTYLSHGLISTPPSLIYETCYYLIKNKSSDLGLYTEKEMGKVCKIIKTLITHMVSPTGENTYGKLLQDRAIALKDVIPGLCSDINTPIKAPHHPKGSVRKQKDFSKRKTLEVLGEGTFAQVFKVQNEGSIYAVKHFGEDEVIKEIANLTLLSHKNTCVNSIIAIEGFIMDNKEITQYEYGAAAFVFTEIGKFSLYDAIKNKKIPTDFRNMISYFKNLLSGLVCFMNNDFIHGDLKPENVVWVNNSSGKEVI